MVSKGSEVRWNTAPVRQFQLVGSSLASRRVKSESKLPVRRQPELDYFISALPRSFPWSRSPSLEPSNKGTDECILSLALTLHKARSDSEKSHVNYLELCSYQTLTLQSKVRFPKPKDHARIFAKCTLNVSSGSQRSPPSSLKIFAHVSLLTLYVVPAVV